MFISEEPASVTGPSHNKRAQVSEELVATAAERCVTHEKCLSFNVTGALITTIEIKSFFAARACFSKLRFHFLKSLHLGSATQREGGAFFPRRNQM